MTCALAVLCSSDNGERTFIFCFYFRSVHPGVFVQSDNSSLHKHVLTSCYAAAGTDKVEKVTAVIK